MVDCACGPPPEWNLPPPPIPQFLFLGIDSDDSQPTTSDSYSDSFKCGSNSDENFFSHLSEKSCASLRDFGRAFIRELNDSNSNSPNHRRDGDFEEQADGQLPGTSGDGDTVVPDILADWTLGWWKRYCFFLFRSFRVLSTFCNFFCLLLFLTFCIFWVFFKLSVPYTDLFCSQLSQ